MRVFKVTYRGTDGEKRKTGKWYVEVVDANGRARRMPGFENRAVSEELWRKLSKLSALRTAGLPLTADLAQWLATMPEGMLARLTEWGLVEADQLTAYRTACQPIKAHLEDYKRALLARESCPEHVATTAKRIETVFKKYDVRNLSDVNATRTAQALAELRRGDKDKPGVSIATSNAYLAAVKGFCRWCVRDGRMVQSPAEALRPLTKKTDIRRKRRALSAEELRRLIEAARKGEPWRGMPGPERALLYQMAASTGLRWNELRSLTAESFDLKGNPPTVTVGAAYSKRRREDVLPLHPDTARAMRDCLAAFKVLPGAMVFRNMPKGRVGAKMIRCDLSKTGVELDGEEMVKPIPFENDLGRADFHALRHSFCSALARAGVAPKTAQDLARHSDVNLTLSLYSHTLVEDRAEALKALPDLTVAEAEAGTATGTDGKPFANYLQGKPPQGAISCHEVQRRATQGGRGASGKEALGNKAKGTFPKAECLVEIAGLEPAASRVRF